ncbi:putative bifunctional diguanylate cyclase/phosphodiesterase [Allosphingosinicella indica]|uniref:EAL domain, c-di-GMP-specific phosphodiesterase class I (Or its enzymatically inactive variant) n=1 Tax=Allosphingosinicella indica TaxID=941907 RepID=A0A1X7H2T2_9SPHN|nr:EAL domain-containing protein [Allosphingosinicella indica]SMF78757.1 EAL domain, c-di-GMP-specific phosphodiesterase class I (or its enzymatically inactive variant) [Allosphingosinicella indica]
MQRERTIRVQPKWRLFRPGAGEAAGMTPLVYVALYTLCLAISQWNATRYGTIIIWPANGVLLAALLQLHREPALRVMAVCFALNLAGNFVRGDAAPMIVLNAALNLGEVCAVALLARRFCGAALDLRRPGRLARFVFLAVAPVVSAAAAVGLAVSILIVDVPTPLTNYELWVNFQTWFTVDALGLILVAPTLLLLANHKRFSKDEMERPALERYGLVGITVLVTGLVFAQAKAPVLFMIFPPLLLVAFRLPPAWSALTVLLVAMIGGAATFNGYGPITLSTIGPDSWWRPEVLPLLRTLPVYQMFLAAVLCVSLPASTFLTERRRLEARLKARTEAAVAARAEAERAERWASHLAHHDPDTDLLNRAGIERALAVMIKRNNGRQVFMAALGIDRFGAIRAAIGASQASLLLAHAARRIDGRLPGASVGRLSSTSIGVAFPARNSEDALKLLLDARQVLAEPLEVGDSRVDVRLTTGLAGYPDHAATATTLVERAQIALDQARVVSGDFALFDAAVERAATGGLSLLSELRKGLDTGDVWLAYQPKLDLKTGQLTGVEALVRWNHPTRGAVAPDEFMPLVEETGFIDPLTDWIVARAVEEQTMLRANGMDVRMAVNISGRSLSDPGFAERTIGIAAPDRQRPNMTLEITETAIITHADAAFANLARLKEAGFGISIDDYGTGLSSLAYLKRIPADQLKIDRTFVAGVARNGNDAVLVRSTIDLAHSLGLRVVAEGIEDQATLDLLALFGCDMAQGFYIGLPVAAETLIRDGLQPWVIPSNGAKKSRKRAA